MLYWRWHLFLSCTLNRPPCLGLGLLSQAPGSRSTYPTLPSQEALEVMYVTSPGVKRHPGLSGGFGIPVGLQSS